MKARLVGTSAPKSVRSILERYSQYLISQGILRRTTSSYVRVVEHFGRWLGRRHICQSVVQQFLDQGLPACQCSGVSRDRRLNRAACITFLRCLGQDRREATLPQGWQGDCSNVTKNTSSRHEGLHPATICQHLRYTRAMLSRLGCSPRLAVRGWTPELIEQYVAGTGRASSPRSRHVGWCARRFYDFFCKTA